MFSVWERVNSKHVTEHLRFVLGRVENIVGKGGNAAYH